MACRRAERAPIPTRRGGGGEQWGLEGGRADTPALRSATSLPSACRSWSFGTMGEGRHPDSMRSLKTDLIDARQPSVGG